MKKSTILLLITLSIYTPTVISCKKATLSLSPEQNEVNFNPDGTPKGNATFTVITNQISWDATVNQSWVMITKTAIGFTLSAEQNSLSTAPEPAIVTVTAKEADPIEIYVTQEAPINSR